MGHIVECPDSLEGGGVVEQMALWVFSTCMRIVRDMHTLDHLDIHHASMHTQLTPPFPTGIQPLPQSYAILIYAFMQEGMVREAQAVYASAVRAGVDKRPAWLMLTTQLFEHSETPGVRGWGDWGVIGGLIGG